MPWRGGPSLSEKYSTNQYQSIWVHLSDHSRHYNGVLSRALGLWSESGQGLSLKPVHQGSEVKVDPRPRISHRHSRNEIKVLAENMGAVAVPRSRLPPSSDWLQPDGAIFTAAPVHAATRKPDTPTARHMLFSLLFRWARRAKHCDDSVS